MAKRTPGTTFRPWWPTPQAAVQPLLACLAPATLFLEPCAGDGALMRHLEDHGHLCTAAFDIEPRHHLVRRVNALEVIAEPMEVIITNPPFERALLVPLLDHWIGSAVTWLLLPSDLLMNRWFSDYAGFVTCVAPIGRVSWLGNGKGGMDNHAWVGFGTEGGNAFLRPRL